jgi:hypothetical protein
MKKFSLVGMRLPEKHKENFDFSSEGSWIFFKAFYTLKTLGLKFPTFTSYHNPVNVKEILLYLTHMAGFWGEVSGGEHLPSYRFAPPLGFFAPPLKGPGPPLGKR